MSKDMWGTDNPERVASPGDAPSDWQAAERDSDADYETWRDGGDIHQAPATTAHELESALSYVRFAINALRCALPEHGDKPLYQEIHLCLLSADMLDKQVSHTLSNARDAQ